MARWLSTRTARHVRRARPGQAADVELEGGVAAFVFTQVDPVPPDLG